MRRVVSDRLVSPRGLMSHKTSGPPRPISFSGLRLTELEHICRAARKNEDIRKIAEELGVTNVLEGSVRRAGNRLRVTAQLIQAADGTYLWSQRYDREMTDVFAVQDEIATAIAGALKVNLTGKLATARPHQPNLPAYEAFLKGKHQYSKHSVEGYARAEEYFKQAIALDPHWADPHSLLSGLCFNLASMGLRPLREMMPLARAEARHALELLPSEPMAHAALGAIAALHDYDWKEAGEQFRLAMESESLPPFVRLWYSRRYLMPLGRFEEAIQEEEKAVTQDPLNPVWRIRQAFTLICAEMYERGIAGARIALDLDDGGYEGHLMIALSYFFQGKPAEARAPAEEAFRIAPWDPLVVGLLAGVLARAGEKERAEKLIATRPDGLSVYFTMCSEVDAAIDAYERLIEQRHPLAAMVASAGFNKPLRASPRWSRLAKMMNLPESVS